MEFPLITIALAIYKPNLSWLKKQLLSLDSQDYSNLELLVWNDCPDDSDYEELFEECIKEFKYSIFHSAKNLGSNAAFGELTKLAKGEYIAYCDQDDEWLPNKISEMYKAIISERADLVCCDSFVIDAEGKILANSIIELRPKQIFYEGKDIFGYLIKRNFVTGCASLVRTEFAVKAYPIPEGFYHDWWIAIYIAAYGKIYSLKKSLLRYRIHSNNQTDAIKSLKNKEEYYLRNLLTECKRMDALKKFYGDTIFSDVIGEYARFIDIRIMYRSTPTFLSAINMMCYIVERPKGIILEIFMPLIPEWLLQRLCNYFWRNRL